MRIIFVLSSLELGGAERQALLLADLLRKSFHIETEIVGIGAPGRVNKLCEQMKLPCYSVKSPLKSSNRFLNFFSLFSFCKSLRQRKPDVILSYCSVANIASALVWRFTSAIACIWNQRDGGLDSDLISRWSFAVKLASGHVSNSTAGKLFLEQRGVEYCEVIFNGVALAEPIKSRDQWRDCLGISNDTTVFCKVANLSSNKSHEKLVYAWHYAKNYCGLSQNSILLCAGRFDDKTDHIKNLISSLEVEDSIRLLGEVDDISGLLSAVDVGVFSSRHEGVPNGVLECMAAGLPMVATDILGVRDAVGESSNNVLVNELKFSDFGRALAQMEENKKQKWRDGRENKMRIAQCFSPEKLVENYFKYIQNNEWQIGRTVSLTCTDVFRFVMYFAIKCCKKLLHKFFSATSCEKIKIKCRNLQQKLEKIYRLLPFSFSVATKLPSKPRIGIAVLSYNRPEFLEKCLDTLFETDIEGLDVTFLIHDDGSTEPAVFDIINQLRDSKYNIVRVCKPKGHNSWGAAFNSAMRELEQVGPFDIIGSCDSDALFHPQWLKKTLEICIWAKANHKDHLLGPFSPFNSSDSEFHNILGKYESPYGDYVVKERMGALVYLFYYDDYARLGAFAESKDDETIKTKQLKRLRVRNFSTHVSYVEHIGHDSVLNKWRPTPVTRAVYGLNLVEEGWPPQLAQSCTLGFYKVLKDKTTVVEGGESLAPLDVLIPAVPKDSETLPIVLQSLYRNLLHPIGNIFVVGPKCNSLMSIAEQHNAIFVNESDVLPIPLEQISYYPGAKDRRGWLAQQFIKLYGDKICNQDMFLVIDSDTILVRPQKFQKENKSILLVSDEFHRPYYTMFKRLFGYSTISNISFVSHMMLFNRFHLEAVRKEVAQKNGQPFCWAIIDQLDLLENSGFSEYETYGHWMLIHHDSIIRREYFNNLSLRTDQIASLDELIKNYSEEYRSVSFHSYTGSR